MGLSALLKKQVRLAFKTAGDLAKTVVLTQKNVSGFDFTNSAPTVTATTTVTAKAFVTVKEKKANQKEPSPYALSGEIFISSEDIKTLSDYDTAAFDGETWKLLPPFSNDGYIFKASIGR